MKKNKVILTVISLVMIVSLFAACAPQAAAPSGGEKVKIGLSFSDFATERWKNEADLMTKLLNDKGYDVIVQEANHDVKLQNDQIDNMISQGVKGLIVIAEDGDAAVTAVDKAADAGVIVIAYDRLIKTSRCHDSSGYPRFHYLDQGQSCESCAFRRFTDR